MMNKQIRLELDEIFRLDAAEIFAAHQRARIIHGSTNIDAAGDEVEVAVRTVLGRRFPSSSYVGQGHIVDEKWHSSKQFDVIIADNFACPILFTAANGTAYFPYESVYAVGEVKSSYRSLDDVTEFCSKISHLVSTLHRENTPNDFINSGRGRGVRMLGQMSLDRRPYKNPLFTFMIFANGERFKPKQLVDYFSKQTDIGLLPCLICFLDTGVVAYGRFTHDGQFAGIHELPKFSDRYLEQGMFSQWVWLCNKDEQLRLTHPLAWLYFQLSAHIHNCVLMPPELIKYGQQLIDMGESWWKPLDAIGI